MKSSSTDDDWQRKRRQVTSSLFQEFPEGIARDQEHQKAKQHSNRQNAKIGHENKVTDKFQKILIAHTDTYRKFTDDPAFKKLLCETLFRLDYGQGSGAGGRRIHEQAVGSRSVVP